MKKLLGIDIGGTKCAVVLSEYSDLDNKIMIVDNNKFSTESSRGVNHTIII